MTMRISTEEQRAIQHAIAFGRQHGFGNLIAHLKCAWASTMMQDFGMPESVASESVGGLSMPLAMHRDIVERREWDETGKRYRKTR